MTEFLTENVFLLPGGLVQQDQGLNRACVRPLSGREEDWLARHAGTPSAVLVTWLLNACLLSLDGQPVDSDLVRQLLVADRDYLILQLRRLTLGDQVQAVVQCPVCTNPMDVSFLASEVPVTFRPQTTASYALELTDRTVRFRLPTGGDQEAMLGGRAEDAADGLLQRCLLEVDGQPLSSEEREAVIAAMERLAPQIDLELDVTCPECSRHFLAPFDTTAFFFQEMGLKQDQLLHEVHALAFYYHWSEAEILGLERDRRRAYLRLLNESLRQN